MNMFEAVRENVDTKSVARHYGIKINRSGMACCPFHNDKSPSMKIGDRYFCFGCGEKGDAVDFVSKYFGLSVKDAAIKICEDLGLTYDKVKNYRHPSIKKKLIKPKKTNEQIFRETCNHCYRVLCEYLNLLKRWKTEYVPVNEDLEWHPYFVEALQNIDHIEHLLDILWDGNISDRVYFLKYYGKKVIEIEQRTNEFYRGADKDNKRSSRTDRKKQKSHTR